MKLKVKRGYVENDIIGGKDPYSASKGMAELAIRSYVNSFFKAQDSNIRIGVARAGNVIGGGDWASDRIVPDCMVAWANDKVVKIRSPNSTRPWQHVLEPLAGYLTLLEALYNDPLNFNEAWNFGPEEKDSKTVKWIVNKIINSYPDSNWSVDKDNHPHEANSLKLDISKAKNKF